MCRRRFFFFFRFFNDHTFEYSTVNHACCTYSDKASPWPPHSKSEWKPSCLIDSGTAPNSLKGMPFSLPPWKDAATLENNKVSFFFRPCCRHSIMHRPFNGALCAALALMQCIHPSLPWSERWFLCVTFHFCLKEITCCEFMSAGISFFLLFFDFPTTNLYTSNAVCCAGGFLANVSPLGSAFQHQKFIRDALKDMTCYTNMMVQEEKKDPLLLRQHLLNESAAVLCGRIFIDALRWRAAECVCPGIKAKLSILNDKQAGLHFKHDLPYEAHKMS